MKLLAIFLLIMIVQKTLGKAVEVTEDKVKDGQSIP